jgi:hypothetical protein
MYPKAAYDEENLTESPLEDFLCLGPCLPAKLADEVCS